MEFFEATATIKATPLKVWAVLVDVANWPNWDSGVDAVEGTVALGNKLVIHATVASGRAFPVKVSAFDAPKTLQFRGGMPLGAFTGVRTYSLTPDGDTTVLHMREEYTGAMLPMIWKSMPDLGPSFTQFVTGLTKRVEADG
ncbi:MAG: SRPBCC domain-containing protein [Rhodoglobus sp.]